MEETAAAIRDFSIDEELVRRVVSVLEVPYRHYFSVSVHGAENLPAAGPALLVGNHSGAVNSPDMLMMFVAWYKHQGYERPLHALAHDVFFKAPLLGDTLRRFGAVPAGRESAEEILRSGGFLLVYPGGDRDAFKPFGARNRVSFYGRLGFIRLALRTGAPILPVVARGGHETLFVISSGRRIARALGLDKSLRMDVLPVSFSVPYGITIGPFMPYVPLPIHIRIKFGEPIVFDNFSPADADDPETVELCHRHIVNTMQKLQSSLSERKRSRP